MNFRILPLRGDQDEPCPQSGTYRSTIPSRKAAWTREPDAWWQHCPQAWLQPQMLPISQPAEHDATWSDSQTAKSRALAYRKKTKGQNRRPPSFSLLLLRDISVLRSLKNSLLSISLSFTPSPSVRLYSCRLSLGNITKNTLHIYLTINLSLWLSVRVSLLLQRLT